jgi:hypothetical protein
MMPKKKTKTVKKPKRRKAARKPAKRKKSSKQTSRTMGNVPEFAVADVVGDDPMGACYWVDVSGVNHCKVTTKSMCAKMPNSIFRPNKQCAGGV